MLPPARPAMCSPLVRPGPPWEQGGPGKGVLWSHFVVRSSYPAAPARRPSTTSSVRLNPCPCEGVIDAPIPLPAPPLSRVAARHCSPAFAAPPSPPWDGSPVSPLLLPTSFGLTDWAGGSYATEAAASRQTPPLAIIPNSPIGPTLG